MKHFIKCNIFLYIFLNIIFLNKFLFSNSQILNHIIKLGNHPYRYNHFSYSSNGDLIIDTESFPITQERKFFGIKKDGKEYFTDNSGNKNFHSSIIVNYNDGRIEGESCFIKIKSLISEYNGKEYLLGISKVKELKYNTEIYNLNRKFAHSLSSFFLFNDIISDVFSIIPDPLNNKNEFNYFISYIAKSVFNTYKLYIIKAHFYINSFIDKGMEKEEMLEIESVNQAIVSCFFTSNKLYICLYTNNNKQLIILAFEPLTKSKKETDICNFNVENYSRFYKGIHLKDELGFFTYFKDNETNPYFSIYQIKKNEKAKMYKSYNEITILGSYNNYEMLNDLIKLNDKKICFVGASFDKEKINIITFSFYSSYEYMNARYYILNLFEEKMYKLFYDLKISSFNNFLLMAFSYCEQGICEESENSHQHFSSLIFFSYPNSSDINFDIIEYILPNNNNIQTGIIINFNDSFIIENNIFGYEIKGRKILNYSNDIILTKNGSTIKPGTIIEQGDKIQLKFKFKEAYSKGDYIIEYAYVLTEPDYEIYNQKAKGIYKDYGDNKKNEKEYFQKNEYKGRSSNFIAKISENLQTKCMKKICSLCYSNRIKECVTCLYDFKYNSDTKSKICLNSSKEEDDMNKRNEQFQSIYKELQSQISPNKSQIRETENAIFQISSLTEQKNNDNPNISSIDLGECEAILKNKSGLSEDEDLIIYKIDIKNDDSSQTYVQYEIYNPKTLNIIPLDECKDIPISVNVPVNLDENTLNVYNSLSQSGYNLFNINDDFYNDICSTYTTENGTDLTLADRKNIIYDKTGNINLCQQGCTLKEYNITTKKSQCNCAVQTNKTITNLEEIKFSDSSIKSEFFDTLKNSNFRVLECYKLVFSSKGQKNNIGSYIMSGLCFIFIILLLVFIIEEKYKLNIFVYEVIQQKMNYFKENKGKGFYKGDDIEIFNKKSKHKKNKKKTETENKKAKNKFKDKNKKRKKNNQNYNKTSEELFPPRKKSKFKITNESITFKSNGDKSNSKQSKTLDKLKNENNELNLNSKKDRKKALDESQNKPSNNNSNTNIIKNIQDYMLAYKKEELTDQELNTLNYEIAIIIDKRTYFQYYFSLIKKKHLILFAFYPNKDYNLIAAKISLLILSFSLYFTINGFFFTDETMNKINEDHGKYNFLYQIPQLLYSTLISSVINFSLKLLSLSEKQILSIKQEKDLSNIKQNSKKILKCLKIKITIFFILSFLFMLFFWYFISCFCAVYKNTQIILITDTLISFALSMIYPFALNLFPGCLRISALRVKEKDKKYLYILSGYIALI